jgi:hypothetical protein
MAEHWHAEWNVCCVKKKTFYAEFHYAKCYDADYTITILHRLFIYTSMNHSLLQTQIISTCASLFGHHV